MSSCRLLTGAALRLSGSGARAVNKQRVGRSALTVVCVEDDGAVVNNAMRTGCSVRSWPGAARAALHLCPP